MASKMPPTRHLRRRAAARQQGREPPTWQVQPHLALSAVSEDSEAVQRLLYGFHAFRTLWVAREEVLCRWFDSVDQPRHGLEIWNGGNNRTHQGSMLDSHLQLPTAHGMEKCRCTAQCTARSFERLPENSVGAGSRFDTRPAPRTIIPRLEQIHTPT